MMVVRDTIAKSRPDIVKEIYRMLHESRRAAPPAEGGPLDPGVSASRPIAARSKSSSTTAFARS